MKFLYPEKDPNTLEEEDLHSSDQRTGKGKNRKGGKNGKSSGGRHSKANTSFYVDIQTEDDVEKMKRRAEENKMFVYVKMTELPVRLSYKGLNKVRMIAITIDSFKLID